MLFRSVKMDAQGFECNILEGMGQAIASGIEVIKFEYAKLWLDGQNCTDLFDRFYNYGFDVYELGQSGKWFGKPVKSAPHGHEIMEFFAKRENVGM